MKYLMQKGQSPRFTCEYDIHELALVNDNFPAILFQLALLFKGEQFQNRRKIFAFRGHWRDDSKLTRSCTAL
jgi:hypothetical protein